MKSRLAATFIASGLALLGASAYAADTTAPVITPLSPIVRTSSAAALWSTNEASDSQVEYGLTTAYGSLSPFLPALVTSHGVTFMPLAPGTLYHYRVKSRDAAGNLAVGPDRQLTTLADTSPPQVLIIAPVDGGAAAGPVVRITATAWDNVGVAGVRFKVDGVDLDPEATAAPYSVAWDATDQAGVHTLTAVARDATGNSKTVTSQVIVAPSTTSFTFAAGGNLGQTGQAALGFQDLGVSGATFFLALGDLSNATGQAESVWCDLVKSYVGASFPFELIPGNHEEDGQGDGLLMNYAACLPDRMGSTGAYATQYYFDYHGRARFIMTSPALTIDGVDYLYDKGNANYNWLSDAIDGARAAGLRWVIVATHYNCLTMGTSGTCDIGSDMMDLLIAKRVDLVLQSQAHDYQRSKQLTCATKSSFPNAACVTDDGSDNVYTKGLGTVFVISGAFGRPLENITVSDSEAPYFAKWMGLNVKPTFGYSQFNVTPDRILAQYVATTSGTFSDAFSIVSAVDVASPTITAGPTAVPAMSGVTVSWTTDELSDSQIIFGPDPGYGSSTTVQSALVTAHSLAFSGLEPNRAYHFKVRSRDGAGNAVESGDLTATTLPDNTPPSVAVFAPVHNAEVGGTAVVVAAAASDGVAVAGVQFKVDGVALGAEDATAPYGAVWNTTQFAAGPHTVTATARDSSGNLATASITATVVPNSPAFTFIGSGDIDKTAQSAASFQKAALVGATFFVALGDLSYGSVGTEQAWCNLALSNLGAQFPFQLVSGNHEDDTRINGFIGNFTACAPDRMGSSGFYGRQYYFDYHGLVRVIAAVPNLTIDGKTYAYQPGDADSVWISTTIDAARAAGIPWVVVAEHKNCITMGVKSCEIGPAFMNLLIAKGVDLVLQGHEHDYQRSKQLVCASSGVYAAGCVADDGADKVYAKGSGTIFVVSGAFGRPAPLNNVSVGDSEKNYFASWMGGNATPTYGFMQYNVSATKIAAQFVATDGGSFADSFVISQAAAPQTVVLSAAAASPTGISWSWTDAADEAGYRLLDSGETNVSGALAANAAGFAETGLSTNTAYARRVEAANASGASTSSVVTAYTLAAPPTGFTLVSMVFSSMTLSWGANTNPAGTVYEVKHWIAGGSTTTVTVSTTHVTLSGLPSGTTLYAAVRALNGDGAATAYDVSLSTMIIPESQTVDSETASSVAFEAPSGPIQLEIPSNAFDSSVQVMMGIPSPGEVPAPPPELSLPASPIQIRVTLSRSVQPSRAVTLTMDYRDSDVAGFDKKRLVVAWYDELHSAWVPLFTTRQENRLTARVNHFSLFQVLAGASAADLSNMTIGPNVLRPNRNPGQVMTFRNLSSGARVRVYTILGELLYDTTENGSGLAAWDGRNQAGKPVASGIYTVLVEGAGGSKMVNVAVER